MPFEGDGLAPLPTTFDPDALSSATIELEDVIVVQGAEREPLMTQNTQEEPADDNLASANITSEQHEAQETLEVAEEADGMEHESMSKGVSEEDQTNVQEETQDVDMEDDQTDEDRPEVNQDLMGILQSLRGTGEEEEEEGEEELQETIEVQGEEDMEEAIEPIETALSSPLSDLPDLPSQLPPSPDPPVPRTLPPFPDSSSTPLFSRKSPSPSRPTSANPPGPSFPAESSRAALNRIVSASSLSPAPSPKEQTPIIQRPYNPPKAKPKTSAKSKSKAILIDSDDDLCSIDGADEPIRSINDIKSESRNDRASSRDKRKKVNPDEDNEVLGPKRRKRLDPISYQPRESDPPEKIVPRTQGMNQTQMQNFLKGKTKEVQLAPCLRPRYAKWGKCTQCISKIGGDSCRFRDYRVFPIDPMTTEILGPGTFESTEWKDKMTPLPREFNVPFTEDHMKRIERTVAPLLLPLITRELRHVVRNEAIKRGTDAAKHRAVCDFCSSTIFGGWWFCKKCGRDYCLVCERYFADTSEKMEESPWHLPPAARPRLLRCIANAQATAVPAQSRKSKSRGKDQKDSEGEGGKNGDDAKKEGIKSADQPATVAEAIGEVENTTKDSERQADVKETEDEKVDSGARHVSSGKDGSPFSAANSGPDTTPAKENGRTPRGKAFHFRPDLQPVSRFSEADLRSHWLQLAEFVLHSEGNVGERLKLLGLTTADDQTIEQMQNWLAKLSVPADTSAPPLREEEVMKLYTKQTHSTAKVEDPAGLHESSLKFMFIDNKDLSLEVFDQLWARGEPIIVDHVGDGLKLSWTPKDFIARFGREVCVVQDCQTNKPAPKTVKEFFDLFQNKENRGKEVLKLKDWPQTNDFKDSHPDLYNDFSDALPVPDFTRREGVLNLYAHFPPGPTRPDIGPKMYNAFEAIETPGGQGSTRMHMDVADAVNVMLYASDRSDGQPGCAVWDLFRAEDADKIRTYLRGKYDKTHSFTDPIHSQLFYLDSKSRRELADKFGVVSWRVYQYPGQAVFIPAGCAHQVCNLADCIKIALDFVSLHNVSRCQQLTQDFRTENFVKAWKEDVLQLYNVLWYAWTNVSETRQRRLEEEKAKEEEIKQREARVAQLQAGRHDDPGTPHSPYPSSAFGASPYAMRGASQSLGMSLYGAAVSSVRDEENTRSPSAAHSRTSSPSRGADPPTQPSHAIPAEDMDGTVELTGEPAKIKNGDAPDKAEEAEEMESSISPTRNFAEKLLTATLLASEPPPPPEARAPSAATKWGLSAARLSQASSAPRPSPKPKSTVPTRLTRGHATLHRADKAEETVQSQNGSHSGDGDSRPKRVPTSQLIQMGMLPIDIAVSAARLQMGEGADEDHEEDMEPRHGDNAAQEQDNLTARHGGDTVEIVDGTQQNEEERKEKEKEEAEVKDGDTTVRNDIKERDQVEDIQPQTNDLAHETTETGQVEMDRPDGDHREEESVKQGDREDEMDIDGRAPGVQAEQDGVDKSVPQITSETPIGVAPVNLGEGQVEGDVSTSR